MKTLILLDTNDKKYQSLLEYHLRNAAISYVISYIECSHKEAIINLLIKNDCSSCLYAQTHGLSNLVDNKKATLSSMRGSRLLLSNKYPLVILAPLAHLHTTNYGVFLFKLDVKKLATPTPKKYTVLPTIVLKTTSLFSLANHYISSAVLIAYDIETATINSTGEDAGDTIITCAGWACLLPSNEIVTFVLPLVSFLEEHWKSEEDYIKAINFLRYVNALAIPKAMHNGMYDSLHSLVYRAPVMNFAIDTMAMMHSTFSELPKTLDFVASIFLPDYIQWKFEAQASAKNRDIEAYWQYNAKDCIATLEIAISQLLTAPSYAKKNYATQFPLIYPCLYCAFEGFSIDKKERDRLKQLEEDKINKELKVLRVYLADENFNPSSPKQVAHYVYKVLGAAIPSNKGAKKANGGTDAKSLSNVADQHPLLMLVASAITRYRKAVKAKGTYFEIALKKDLLLWSLNPFGTDTGRMSCQSSSFWCGTQIQNTPPYAKSQLIANEGFSIIEVDNSQSEGRCTAYLSEDTALISAIESKTHDFYKTLGTLFFSIPYEEVTDFLRNKVLKKIVHGTNYMMAGSTFLENVGLDILYPAATTLGKTITSKPNPKDKNSYSPTSFCSYLLELYHVPFPKVRQWHRDIGRRVATAHRLVSPLGWTRVFFGDIERDHGVLRSAVAHEAQNLSVAILNKGFMRVYKLVVAPPAGIALGDIRLKAQIHDSILAQIINTKETLISELFIEAMTNPIQVHGRTLAIPLDSKIGKTWQSCK